jgi:hypothetical protein
MIFSASLSGFSNFRVLLSTFIAVLVAWLNPEATDSD